MTKNGCAALGGSSLIMRGTAIATVFLLFVTMFSGVSFQRSAQAQPLASDQPIQDIVIEGTQRIEPESVRSYLTVKAGDVFDPIQLNRSLKSVFSTNLFADVSLTRDGTTLVVNVVENPIINRIAFEGNKSLKDEALTSEISLRPRAVYTRTKTQADARKLLQVYRRSGRFAAVVEPKIIQLPQNRIDLVFEITEGDKTYVNSINFIGNKAFDDSDLKHIISTSETAPWKFLSSSDVYDPDRLTFDRELLRRYYLKKGYADFEVLSVVAELTPDRKAFIVTFTLEEGDLYKFGTVDIAANLKGLDAAALQDQVLTVEGNDYNANYVRKTVYNLTGRVGDLGYAFAKVTPKPDKNTEERVISLTYFIDEGPHVFVERIDIEGNSRTLDHVIRREFDLVEGDAFNSAKVGRSRERIRRLGFFSSADINTRPGSTPDKTVISARVGEKGTGNLSLGAGFSSEDGPLASIGIRERNLLGKGQDLRLNLSVAGSGTQADIGFTEPYFLDQDVSAGFDIFRIEEEDDQLSYDERSTGVALRASYDLSDDLRQFVSYRLEFIELKDIDEDASLLVKEQEGDTVKSSVSTSLLYDKRDTAFQTKDGYILRFNAELAGLGGDVSHLKTIFSARHYTSFNDGQYTLMLGGKIGSIVGLGKDTLIAERFFLGGNGMVGFESAGVGPRDAVTGDPLGGKYLYLSTAALNFPLGLPEEYPVKGRLFANVGATFGVDGEDASDLKVQDSASPRVTIGPGISYNSPFGPLRADFGFAILKEDYDEDRIFNFSFGTSF